MSGLLEIYNRRQPQLFRRSSASTTTGTVSSFEVNYQESQCFQDNGGFQGSERDLEGPNVTMNGCSDIIMSQHVTNYYNCLKEVKFREVSNKFCVFTYFIYR